MKCKTQDRIGPFYKIVLGKNKIDSDDNIQNDLWKWRQTNISRPDYIKVKVQMSGDDFQITQTSEAHVAKDNT